MAAIYLFDSGQIVLEKVLFDILFGLAMGGIVWYLSRLAGKSRPVETLNSSIYGPNIVANLLYYGGTCVWSAFVLMCYFADLPLIAYSVFLFFLVATLLFGHADTIIADDIGLTQQKRFSPDVVIHWDAVKDLSLAKFDGPNAFYVNGQDGAKIKITPFHQGLNHFLKLVFEKTGKTPPVVFRK